LRAVRRDSDLDRNAMVFSLDRFYSTPVLAQGHRTGQVYNRARSDVD
jgi:hypothetical protein